jgi:hypothetical protein
MFSQITPSDSDRCIILQKIRGGVAEVLYCRSSGSVPCEDTEG